MSEGSYEEILNAPHVEDSDDEKDIDQADNFESKYNFRFEEVGEIALNTQPNQPSCNPSDKIHLFRSLSFFLYLTQSKNVLRSA